MIDQREYKTLASMTDKEFAYVHLAYDLEKRLGKVKITNNNDSLLNLFSEYKRIGLDLHRNRDRIQSLNPWLFWAIIHKAFDRLFLQQKTQMSLIALTVASRYLIDLVFPCILLTFPTFAVLFGVFWFVFTTLLAITWSCGYFYQEHLDKQFSQPQPKVVNNDVMYDIHPVKPGEKIWKSLSYSESIYLMFKQNTLEIDNDKINLFDKNHQRIKTWDKEGNIINRP